MSPESMAFKHKKQVKSTGNRYLKPGTLAQLRCSRTTTRSCTDIGKKRVVVLDAKDEKINLFHKRQAVVCSSTPVASPNRIDFYTAESVGAAIKQQMLPATPKTSEIVGFDSLSRLEPLPMDLLVRIICHLHHDQLRAAFHVSQRVRTAVLLARQWYFNYTTPSRSRQDILATQTPLPTEHWPFKSNGIWVSTAHTPKAPKHGPRPPRLCSMDMKQIAAVLFQEATVPSNCIMPLGLPRPVLKPMVSSRVLFYEDELCQAVAHNKLR